ncbi:MAG TPA: DoxX family protein [Caulobacteraceae bacterium]|nr:DoxX family protein [Caulobacteraceae bacterium]
MERLTALSPRVLSILRIVTGLLYLEHGLMKLFQFPVAQKGVPSPLPALILAAGWMEFVGGALILIGLFTRPAAFLLSGEMAYAYWTVHAPASPYPAVNEGEAAILYCFIFFYLIFAGGGAWSVDAMFARRRR